MPKRKGRTPEAHAAVPAPQPECGRLSAKFVLTSLAATLNLTAAMLGVGFPEVFPSLAAMPVMLALFAVGIGLEVWAVRQLLAARRAQAGRGR